MFVCITHAEETLWIKSKLSKPQSLIHSLSDSVLMSCPFEVMEIQPCVFICGWVHMKVIITPISALRECVFFVGLERKLFVCRRLEGNSSALPHILLCLCVFCRKEAAGSLQAAAAC